VKRIRFADREGRLVDRAITDVVARTVVDDLTRQLARVERARGAVYSVLIGRETSIVYLGDSDEAYTVTRAAALLAAAEDAGTIAVYSDGTIERVSE